MEGPRTIQESRGITVIIQMLSNSYWTPYKADKNSLCPACKIELDTDQHLWRCEESHVARNMKNDLKVVLPFGHPMKLVDINSELFTLFCLDPENSDLGQHQLTPRPVNYQRILSLTRLIGYFSHVNRTKASSPLMMVQAGSFQGKRSRGNVM